MTPRRSLLVVIPAWNEEETVGAVIAEVRSVLSNADILVVDDGSTDRTAIEACSAGASVLQLPINLGVGGAMRAGYKYAFRSGYERTVQLDADGQHDPASVSVLIDALAPGDVDVVIGARFAGVGRYEVRGPRRWTMLLLGLALSRVAGTRLTDTTSGLKACGPAAIRLFAVNYPAEYLGDTVEAIVIAARAGLTVRQVPVEMRPRAGGSPSHGPAKAALFLMRALLALGVALSRPATTMANEGAHR